jgi:alanine racemase
VSRLIRAVIDTRALRSNLDTLRGKAGGARVMAVVKANAYGHGLIPVARALSNADGFAVARLEEGIALRDAGVSQPILLLEGVCDADDLKEATRHKLELVVHEARQIDLLERQPGVPASVVWIKADTGMNRLGFRPEEFPGALARIRALGESSREIRLLTHLARADEPASPMTREQLERFRALTHGLEYATSIANSAGIFGWPEARSDWVRPGIALYGISPFSGKCGADLGLVPVMTLETRILTLRTVKRGETVGYGGIWRAPKDSRIAIVAAGYGDGIRRTLPAGTPVLVDGARASLVGRVSMDMLAVDVTDMTHVDADARVVIWGPELPVEENAVHAGTIAYELVCGVNRRVPFEYR